MQNLDYLLHGGRATWKELEEEEELEEHLRETGQTEKLEEHYRKTGQTEKLEEYLREKEQEEMDKEQSSPKGPPPPVRSREEIRQKLAESDSILGNLMTPPGPRRGRK